MDITNSKLMLITEMFMTYLKTNYFFPYKVACIGSRDILGH